MNQITTIGIDLAKSLFTVHGVDRNGRVVLRRTVRREKLMELIATLPPCLIGMEAYGGARHWGRQFEHCGSIIQGLVRPREAVADDRGPTNAR
jgi:transposase